MKTIVELGAALAEGTQTSRLLTEEALALIDAPEGEGPRAFVRVFRDAALRAADESDRLRALGVVPSPLAGIPVAVKDLCDVAGVTTTAGSATRIKEAPAQRDATAVARLRAAGAVIAGTTNMTEFALGGLGLNPHFGDCRNPWDRERGRIPGGSSSGAAVSVADGMVAGALGTDTMGSVRLPAALCGIVGFKPTAARVPLGGIFPLSSTLDSVGPLARSVACCALLDAIFAGEEPRPVLPWPLEGLKFGVPTTVMLDELDPPVANAFQRALGVLARAGATIKEFPFPEINEIVQIVRTCGLSSVEAHAIHLQWLVTRGDCYDPRVRARLNSASQVDPQRYGDTLRLRGELVQRSRKVTEQFDAVLMPTVPVVAPLISQFTDTEEARRNDHPILIRNTCVANYLDRCALTIPCHKPGSAPVGLTLMGEHGADHGLLRIGTSVEAVLAHQLAACWSGNAEIR